MPARDMVLAALTSVIWGFAFVAIKFGLESFSASQLMAVRFLIASLLVFLVPRPKISWVSIVLIGMPLFAGQFLLLFFAYTQGMPPGLASVSQQMQAIFTVWLAAVFLRDIPSVRQCIGMAIAVAGLVLIGLTVGSDLKLTGLGLALAGAFSWAVGNVLVAGLQDGARVVHEATCSASAQSIPTNSTCSHLPVRFSRCPCAASPRPFMGRRSSRVSLSVV